MDGDCGIRRRHTRIVVGALAALATFFAAEPALGQLPLGSQQNGAAPTSGIVGNVTQALPTGQVVEQAAPVVQEAAKPVAAVTQPLAQATAPVAQTAGSVASPAAPVVAQAVAPVAQAAAPVTQAAAPAVAQVTAPVAQAVNPVVQQVAGPALTAVQPVVQPVLQATAPVLTSIEPVLEAAEPLTAPLLEATAPLLEATGPALEVTAPLLETATQARMSPSSTVVPPPGLGAASAGDAAAQSTSTSVSETVPPTLLVATDPPRPSASRDAGAVTTGPSRGATASIESSPPWASAEMAPRDGRTGHTATAGPSRLPKPTAPSRPLGFLTSVSAAPGSGALLVFFAALAAIILVAAPGLGRRLRPDMAPWPLPITLASLERPG